MATLDAQSNPCNLNITPSRKRKRKLNYFEQEQENADTTTTAASCFTNAAFSSTPKKILAKRRIQLKKNKENQKIFPNVCLETISNAGIAKDNGEHNKITLNPYEVLRKPPKKKRITEEIACFENPGLNLELPEKLFNPFEVVREITPSKSSNCFSNPALNLKVQDVSVLCNPFEVQRDVSNHNMEEALAKTKEISPKVDMQQDALTPKPYLLKLGIPFVPRVGCRIDFKDVSISQLTPSKLFAEKLVFSPVTKAKTSLGSIGEETTMDIGKELDRYQLELENSINEAKLRKTGVVEESIILSPPDVNYNQIVDIEKKTKFTQKLSDISEDIENEQIISENIEPKEHNTKKVEELMADTNPFRCDINNEYQRTQTAEVIEIENLDELYGSSGDEREDEDYFDFKSPVPFVRAYTKPDATSSKIMVSKESLESNISKKSIASDDHVKKTMNVKNIIRKSIRKLIHTDQHGQQQQTDTVNKSIEKPDCKNNFGFINAIRHSLRRKPARNLNGDSVSKESEISIIDYTERTLKLKSDVLQTEYLKIEDLTNEKKHNLRNSLRKSTRCVRNQFLKSVFNKKQEEYDLNKRF